jgi:arsenate reductase
VADVTVWFMARCVACRQVQDIIELGQVHAEYVRYMVEPRTRAELEHVMGLLGTTDPRAIARTDQEKWQQAGLDDATDDEVFEALIANPIMLARPIVIRGDQAMIARPPSKVRDMLSGLGRFP